MFNRQEDSTTPDTGYKVTPEWQSQLALALEKSTFKDQKVHLEIIKTLKDLQIKKN